MARTSYIQGNDDVRFVLNQHASLDFYSASPVDRHVAQLRHIILKPRQPVCTLTP